MLTLRALLVAFCLCFAAFTASEATEQSTEDSSSTVTASVAAQAPPAKVGGKWRKTINWDEVERQLEEGDDAELLVSEDALLIAEMERRRAAPPEPPAGVPLQ